MVLMNFKTPKLLFTHPVYIRPTRLYGAHSIIKKIEGFYGNLRKN